MGGGVERYTLDYLVGEFGKHVEVTEDNRIRMIDKFFKENPGKPLPEYMRDEFSLPRALATLVMEIVELKGRVVKE